MSQQTTQLFSSYNPYDFKQLVASVLTRSALAIYNHLPIEEIQTIINSHLLSYRTKYQVLRGKTTLEQIAKGIKKNKYKNIIVMCGAGVSTAAGIPDFRTPGTGLFDNLQRFKIPSPQSIFTLSYFKQNPDPFYQLSKEIWPTKFSPTKTHKFIKLLHDKKVLLRCYTQNIDGLERIAGIPPDRLVEAHGTFSKCFCIQCNAKYSSTLFKKQVFNDQRPLCPYCKGFVKPAIVFFGEDMPKRFKKLSIEDFSKCDLLIVMGTSLQVYPFAGLVNMVPLTTPRVLFNMQCVGPFVRTVSDQEGNYRDVVCIGDCDTLVQELTEYLGDWCIVKPPEQIPIPKSLKLALKRKRTEKEMKRKRRKLN